MSTVVYLNGAFVPYEDALVSVEDRGYVFADGIYEVVRVYGGKLFALEAHLDRLVRSAEAIRLPLPDLADLEAAIREMVARHNHRDGTVYLQVTRGNGPRHHEFPLDAQPNVFMIARPYARPTRELVDSGVSCVTVPDIRWQLCNIKSVGLLPNVLAKQQAKEAGAYEAIFVRDGIVTEGASSNFFIVQKDTLITHPADNHILPGITRHLVLGLAKELGIPVKEETFSVSSMATAAEAFITNTGCEVLAVTDVDGAKIGNGRPGSLTMRLWTAFDRMVRTFA